MNIFQKNARTTVEFILQPGYFYYLPDFTKHYLVGFVELLENLFCIINFLGIRGTFLNVSQHFVDLGSKVSIQILGLQSLILTFDAYDLASHVSLLLCWCRKRASLCFLFCLLVVARLWALQILSWLVNGKCAVSATGVTTRDAWT